MAVLCHAFFNNASPRAVDLSLIAVMFSQLHCKYASQRTYFYCNKKIALKL